MEIVQRHLQNALCHGHTGCFLHSLCVILEEKPSQQKRGAGGDDAPGYSFGQMADAGFFDVRHGAIYLPGFICYLPAMASSLVSIVIPSFNAQSTIAATLESCIQQGYQVWEAIVVDDGSADETTSVVQQFANRDERVQLFSRPHCGAPSARNFGVLKARGAFVKFLDADDVISPGMLERQCQLLEEFPNYIAHASWVHFRESPGDVAHTARSTDRDFNDSAELLSTVWNGAMCPLHAWMMPKELVHERAWDETLTLNQDGAFMAQIIAHAEGSKFSKEVAYYRRPTAGHVSQQMGRQHMESLLRVLDIYRAVCDHLASSKSLKDAYNHQVYTVAYRSSTHPEEYKYLGAALTRFIGTNRERGPLSASFAMRMLVQLLGVKSALRLRAIVSRLQ